MTAEEFVKSIQGLVQMKLMGGMIPGMGGEHGYGGEDKDDHGNNLKADEAMDSVNRIIKEMRAAYEKSGEEYDQTKFAQYLEYVFDKFMKGGMPEDVKRFIYEELKDLDEEPRSFD